MTFSAIPLISPPFLMGNNLNAWSEALAGLTISWFPLGLVIIAAIPLVFIALYALTYGVYGAVSYTHLTLPTIYSV